MKRMIYWMLTATFICGAFILTACTNNNDNPVIPDTPEELLPRISMISSSTSIKAEKFDPVTGEWTVSHDKPGEWIDLPQYYWTGNRLDSVLTGDGLWRLSYDANGNAIRANHFVSEATKYLFEYGSEGRLVRSVKTVPEDETGTRIIIETDTYTYANGKLQKKERVNDYSQIDPNPTSSILETCLYTWEGDNVISTTNYKECLDGTRDTTYVTFDYTTLLNPFYGNKLLQAGFADFFLTPTSGVDALNKNLISSFAIEPEGSQYNYEYTTEGDRVVSFVSTTIAGNNIMRMTSTRLCKLEYAE